MAAWSERGEQPRDMGQTCFLYVTRFVSAARTFLTCVHRDSEEAGIQTANTGIEKLQNVKKEELSMGIWRIAIL